MIHVLFRSSAPKPDWRGAIGERDCSALVGSQGCGHGRIAMHQWSSLPGRRKCCAARLRPRRSAGARRALPVVLMHNAIRTDLPSRRRDVIPSACSLMPFPRSCGASGASEVFASAGIDLSTCVKRVQARPVAMRAIAASTTCPSPKHACRSSTSAARTSAFSAGPS